MFLIIVSCGAFLEVRSSHALDAGRWAFHLFDYKIYQEVWKELRAAAFLPNSIGLRDRRIIQQKSAIGIAVPVSIGLMRPIVNDGPGRVGLIQFVCALLAYMVVYIS